MAEKAAKKQRGRGRPFKKGQSGNPAGRPRGSRNRTTIAAQALLEGEGQALTRQAIDLAMGGNVHALKLCLERLLPPQKSSKINLTLEPLTDAQSAQRNIRTVMQSLASGEITMLEAQALMGLIKDYLATIEVVEFGERLDALETSLNEAVTAAATQQS